MDRYGALYDGVRYWNNFALMYTVLFLFRRMIISFNILYIGKMLNGSLQAMVYVYACTIQLCYLFAVRPLYEPLYNNIDIFNELTISTIVLHLLIFTDFVPDPQMRSYFGWSSIAVVTVNILVNLVLIVVESIFA